MITCMGIYNCTNTNINNDPTSTCNKVVALSAVSEWILSIGWVAYMSTISYDLYHIAIVVELWLVAQDSTIMESRELSNQENRPSEDALQILLPHTQGRTP
jgi:hypothetical protein